MSLYAPEASASEVEVPPFAKPAGGTAGSSDSGTKPRRYQGRHRRSQRGTKN